MKFITEIDLRSLYKEKAFTTYKIEANTRLTPGARQFLLDRKIEILNNDFYEEKDLVEKEESSMELKKHDKWRKKKLLSKLNSAEALFFIVVEETIHRDLILSQEIIELSKEVTSIKSSLKENKPVKEVSFDQCLKTEENINVEDGELNIEITEFHIQLKRGRDILNLHRLRCLLEEIEPIIFQLWEYDEEAIELYQSIIINVNQIVDKLSEKIYCILGGVKC